MRSTIFRGAICGLILAGSAAVATPPTADAAPPAATPAPQEDLARPGETHLAQVRQLTFGGENAEAYWSPDNRELILQSTRPPYACDQIFRLAIDRPGQLQLVSTGTGRTTCAYFFYPQADRILYSSTHPSGDACPPPPDRSHGYVWGIYPEYELVTARPDGSDRQRLTENTAYDAEATVCPRDGAIVFTSTRDGDLELYRMDRDGKNLLRLTHEPGYDGGAFYSPDCSQIVWRASRPTGEDLTEYENLLKKGLVRPSRLEIWVANADGTEAHQVTHLGAASFAPSFFPDGQRIVFSTNAGDPKGREFDLWAIGVDGSGLERITNAPGFDGFPVFSPDGRSLAFASNRHQGQPGETDIYVARWVDGPIVAEPANAAIDRYAAEVAWLADDAREGRGVGTAGLDQATNWLEQRFREIGLAPAGEKGGFRQAFEVPVAIESGAATSLSLGGQPVAAGGFVPLAFSPPSAHVEGEILFAGYGITDEEHGRDDYAGLDAHGKLVLVRRFAPPGAPFDQPDLERRFGDLRYKAWNAREHGAIGLLVVDLPETKEGEPVPDDAPLPKLSVDTKGDAGIPAVAVTRAVGAALLQPTPMPVELTVALTTVRKPTYNVAGRLAAGSADGLPGVVVVGAHYDHLGFGGAGSLTPDSHEPHHGADDNASGTAGLLAVARELAVRRAELQRDVVFVAFSAEEAGVLGSSAYTKSPPAGLQMGDVVAMLNLDMIGRLRSEKVAVLGSESALEWKELVPDECTKLKLTCALSGDGYGPSDQTPFYAAGVPVLFFFTGAHDDYHKPADVAAKINAAGGVQVARLATAVASAIASRPARLTYQAVAAPPPAGDVRSYGAALGTVPDFTGTGGPGVLLAGVRPASAAEQAGIRKGDRLVRLGGHEIRDLEDFTFVLRQAKPGQKAIAVVERDGKRLELEVTYGVARRPTR